jgi:hypothetical protein
VLAEIKNHSKQNGKWIMNTAGKTIAVAGHVIKEIAKRK